MTLRICTYVIGGPGKPGGKTGVPGLPGPKGERGAPGAGGPKGNSGHSGVGGVEYIRWGRTTCPRHAQLLYKGELLRSVFLESIDQVGSEEMNCFPTYCPVFKCNDKQGKDNTDLQNSENINFYVQIFNSLSLTWHNSIFHLVF